MQAGNLKVLPLAVAITTAGAAFSVPTIALAEEAVEEVVVTGLRGKPRSATDSPVPVDVFDTEMIEGASSPDLDDLMQTLVPSYNVARQPISDGATFIRPATLRNLPSHHTLVLVNGKRRHRASLVSIGGSGTQGPDLATIPSTAIKSIEVLRDGASSQYGSDAIAGVINFNLKDNREGVSLMYTTGEFYEDDGAQNRVQGNIGLPLGDNGFHSISGEWFDQEFTERANAYCESWWCTDRIMSALTPRRDMQIGFSVELLLPAPRASRQVPLRTPAASRLLPLKATTLCPGAFRIRTASRSSTTPESIWTTVLSFIPTVTTPRRKAMEASSIVTLVTARSRISGRPMDRSIRRLKSSRVASRLALSVKSRITPSSLGAGERRLAVELRRQLSLRFQ